MQKQVFTGLIYTEFYTPCQHFRNLVSSWEVGKTTCVKQVVNKESRLARQYSPTNTRVLQLILCVTKVSVY